MKGTARRLGLPESTAVFMAGARSRSCDPDDRLEDLLAHSRDAHNRVRAILDVMTVLKESYGGDIPDDETLAGDIGVNLRETFTSGRFEDLLRLRYILYDRAGGPVG